MAFFNSSQATTTTVNDGEWSREVKYQRSMKKYCAELPTVEEITKSYERRQRLDREAKKNEHFMDMRPFTAGTLGRDKDNLTGDFVAVSQNVWDTVRFANLQCERPDGPAHQRAVDRGRGLEEGDKEHLQKMAELKAKTKAFDNSEENLSTVNGLLKSMEESAIKKKRLVPAMHKPYEWDADNPNVGIPWPDVTPNKRANGPAFDRLNKVRMRLLFVNFRFALDFQPNH